LVSVGFRSGNVDVVLKKIADRYEENTNRRLQSIIAILEPTLVIILSVIVGLILLSVILPLMGIMTSIG
jgi:type IV pilus assembly protein PilC